ncbi:MAG: F0F1 ATP synthase subunit delta [Lentisphaeria bacterium]|nr:F0F1 ATP synthase subunit delta [Lentisphaeria bacterium]NQZ66633.1 F0F1 ATP synthase subunit delta [Lentisphaeria bacterium]
MSDAKIAKPYAKSLFELAQETSQLDAVYQDTVAFAAVCENDDFAAFLKNPVLSVDQKDIILDDIFKGEATDLSVRFLRFINSKNRLIILADIVAEFDALYLDHSGIINIEITSASEITDAQIDSIKAKLKDRYKKEIRAVVTIDDSLIGGFTIKIGDTVIDNSVSHLLKKLGKSILAG